MLPNAIVAAEMTQRAGTSDDQPGLHRSASFMNTAKTEAFDMVDRKATTGAGPPSYTSGAQKWNGKSEVLKPRPTISIAQPASPTGFILPPADIAVIDPAR